LKLQLNIFVVGISADDIAGGKVVRYKRLVRMSGYI